VYTGFWWGILRARVHIVGIGLDGRIILRWIFRKWDVGHGLDDPAQEKDWWWAALVNPVMNLWVKKEGVFYYREPVSFSIRTLLHGVNKKVC
jgi:hypothetical protein